MPEEPADDREAVLARLDLTTPHSARVWNYFLGGKDNYAPDRDLGEQILHHFPEIVDAARADRAFLGRAVHHLVGEAGMRQFLDLGTGLPTADNTHEVAQRLAPEARIVYVDNDPLVLVHAQALLTSSPEGVTDYIDGDVHEPGPILERAGRTLDFDKPVALMLLGIMQFVNDDEEAYDIVDRLVAALPSGSHLALAHPTAEVHTEAMTAAVASWNEQGSSPMKLRSREQLLRFFRDLELLDPGVVSCSRWRADRPDIGEIADVTQFCGVGRKP
ncbi:SAM-dependent methyltransferase [Streptomyces sp. VMFN-G11Ma]|uniref:SAM-dependent methyltransferase n=1 Tax=Streptomyces sp. VMFN-G11Ma TaxID=2135609 RepID=UPI000D38646A|nr:SAM-dependent methyltransferase [Streptomyces sp. VMFN-G11Ma]PTM93962.1 S-adenosyl methyltransferase [Streptomyces sp. VMFN-G11Ma]